MARNEEVEADRIRLFFRLHLWWKNLCDIKLILSILGYVVGTLGFVILPPLKLSEIFSGDRMQSLSDTFTLLGFGMVITLMGVKSAFQFYDERGELFKHRERNSAD